MGLAAVKGGGGASRRAQNRDVQLVGSCKLSGQVGLLSHQVGIHLRELNEDIRFGIKLNQERGGGHQPAEAGHCPVPMPLSSVWTVRAFWPSDHCCGSSQQSRTHVKTF